MALQSSPARPVLTSDSVSHPASEHLLVKKLGVFIPQRQPFNPRLTFKEGFLNIAQVTKLFKQNFLLIMRDNSKRVTKSLAHLDPSILGHFSSNIKETMLIQSSKLRFQPSKFQTYSEHWSLHHKLAPGI